MKKISTILISFFMISLCVLCMSVRTEAADAGTATAEKQVIRVGYIDYEGFIEKQNDGTYQGYAVSYLNEIAKYTGWGYSFVFDSWENCLQKLKDGEIDILCSAQYTDERAQYYEYSDMPIGNESGVLYTRADNTDIYYDDYETINGMTIGVLADSYQTEILDEYAAEHHFTYQEKEYDSETDMKRALGDGEVDLIASGSLALHKTLKTVALFGSAPFYIIGQKGNTELMEPINNALIEIKDADPYFESNLYEEYYATSATTTLPRYTREEAEYIQNCDTIPIGVFRDSCPLSSYDSETGEYSGIVEDVVDEIAERSGLKFQFVSLDPEERPLKQLQDESVDMVAGMIRSETFLEDPELQVSNEMFEDSAVIVEKKGVTFTKFDGMKVALPSAYQFMSDYLKNNYNNCNIIYLDNTEECLSAVLAGEVDITVQNAHIISYLLQKPKFSDLTIISTTTISEPSSIIANKNIDPILISILNKTIDCIGDKTIQQIITNHTVGEPYETTTKDFLYQYRTVLILILALLVIGAFASFMIARQRTIKAVHEKETQLLRTRAEYDMLTEIYNRATFYEKTKEMLQNNPNIEYDIVCADIDRFKIVNDLYGTDEGDNLLKFVATTIKKNVEEKHGICGRIGGNNFACCMPRKLVSMTRLYDFTKTQINGYVLDMDINMRFGIYHIDDVTVSITTMCDRANMAMEKVKGSALNHVAVYSKEQRMDMLREQDILNDMYSALKENQFCVYIQSKCRLDTEEVIGGEALVRWKHPKRGMISPGEFIPVFEKNGFIVKLDEYMWDQTCKLIHDWKAKGEKVPPISVNVSRLNFYATDLVGHMKGLIEKYGLTPDDLELEVTESAFTENDAIIYSALLDLQKAGFKVLMDDFGSGYSSLNMLKEAPVDVIKMDLRLIQGADPMGRGIAILKGIMSMAETMHLPVIAEGVETEENVQMLKSIHCELGQGYYYSRPVSSDLFEQMILRTT